MREIVNRKETIKRAFIGVAAIAMALAPFIGVAPTVNAYSNGIWSPAPGLALSHFPRVVLLPNGDAVAAGATTQDPVTPVYVYKALLNAWVPAVDIPTGRQGVSLAPLSDQRALIAGGHIGSGPTDEVFIFDSTTTSYVQADDLIYPVESSAAHTLSDGRVVLIGGFGVVEHVVEPQIFDPNTETWSLGQPFPLNSVATDPVLLPDGRILARAGPNTSSGDQERVFIYDPILDAWTETGSLAPFAAFNGRMTLMSGGRVMAFSFASTEIWDPNTGLWSPAAPLPVFGGLFGTATLSDGDILATTFQASYVYKPDTDIWEEAPLLPLNNNWGWTVLNDGSLLVASQEDLPFSSYRFVSLGSQEQATIQVVADTHVRSGQANHNYGSQEYARIQSSGDNRALVRFDQTDIETAVGSGTVVSAKLRLIITDNGDNWGATGRTVGAHRLLVDWAEGNGTEGDRGDGSGATWNCAIDSNISSLLKNCSGVTEWEMGQPNNPLVHPWLEIPTDSQTVTNGATGVIEYDVTADVQDFVSGAAENHGWLIKKTNENQSGQVSFGTKESPSGAELVVTYQP